jgi:hypothetical protein
MKKLLAFAAALPLLFGSCGTTDVDIVGTWNMTEVDFNIEGSLGGLFESAMDMGGVTEFGDIAGHELTFLEDGTLYVDDEQDNKGTYILDGNKLTLTSGGEELTGTVKVSGQDIHIAIDMTDTLYKMMGAGDDMSGMIGSFAKKAVEKTELIIKGTRK